MISRLCIDSDETVRYNLLLEDQEEPIEEALEDESETEDTQDVSYEEVLELEEEDDSYMNDNEDPVIEEDVTKFEVLDLDEIDARDGIRIDNKSNIAIITNSQPLKDVDEVTAKMKAAHYAKEQMKKHKCPYCDKTFMYPSKGEFKVIEISNTLIL